MRVQFKVSDDTRVWAYVADVGNGLTVEYGRSYPGEWNVYVKENGTVLYWRTVVNMISDPDVRDAYRARDVPYVRARSNALRVARYFAGQSR